MKKIYLVLSISFLLFCYGCEKYNEKFDDTLVYVQMINDTSFDVENVKLGKLPFGSITKDSKSEYQVVEGDLFAHLTPIVLDVDGEEYFWQTSFCGTGAVPELPGKYQYILKFRDINDKSYLSCEFRESED